MCTWIDCAIKVSRWGNIIRISVKIGEIGYFFQAIGYLMLNVCVCDPFGRLGFMVRAESTRTSRMMFTESLLFEIAIYI